MNMSIYIKISFIMTFLFTLNASYVYMMNLPIAVTGSLRHELSSPFKHWDRGLESHTRNGCLCAFILCLCCSVCR
jgi:hypothetical protein